MFRLLDVGCGDMATGHVNLDINMNQMREDNRFVDPNVPNPIKADCHFLPFRNESFDIVYSRAVLEHIKDPSKALREMLRVARNEILIIVPHRCFRRNLFCGQPKVHIHFFSALETRKWIKRITGFNPLMKIYRRGFPSDELSIIRLPSLIEIRIIKR